MSGVVLLRNLYAFMGWRGTGFTSPFQGRRRTEYLVMETKWLQLHYEIICWLLAYLTDGCYLNVQLRILVCVCVCV